MKRVIMAAVSAVLVLSGCSSKSITRERIMVTALGIHEVNGGYRVSVQAVDALKTASSLSEQEDAATTVYEADGESVSMALDAFLNEAGRRTYILQNRVIVISEACLRRRSLYDALAYVMQNREGRAQVAIAMCRGNPSDVLNVPSGNDAIPANYVVGLLKEGCVHGMCRYTTLLEAERTASGMYDAVLPIVTMKDDTLMLDGTALFCDGQYRGELTAAETRGFSLLSEDAGQVLYTVGGVTYRVHNVRTAIAIERDGDGYSYRFDVSGEVSVVEQPSDTAVDFERVTGLLREEMQAALDALDSADCDALGLSRRTAKQYPSVKQTTVRSSLSRYDKTVAVTIS